MTQAQSIENLVAWFEARLTVIVNTARRNVTARLLDRLSIVDGVVAKTKSNQRVLQSVQELFRREMRAAGYPALVNEYAKRFGGQLEFFNETLDRLAKQINKPLTIDFGKRDLDLFKQQQVTTVRLLETVVDNVAASAERAAMLSVGGLKASVLISAIAEKIDATLPQARTLADTALSTYYRTIQDRGYRLIERELPAGVTLTYSYGGPDDKFTRPFCHERLKQARAGKTWTREEIDRMSNGQLPNVFLTGGGYNCRHQWLVIAAVG